MVIFRTSVLMFCVMPINPLPKIKVPFSYVQRDPNRVIFYNKNYLINHDTTPKKLLDEKFRYTIEVPFIEILQEGLDFLSITDIETITYIHLAREDNFWWNQDQIIKSELKKRFENRFEIKKGETKKYYTLLLKKTQKHIEETKEYLRNNPDSFMFPDELIQWIEKKKNIKNILKYHNSYGNNKGNLLKAKAYPIEQLIEFDSAGFAKCLYHPERTASTKLYKQSNSIYCFSCHKKSDSLDVYMVLYNVTLQEAIKKLS